MRKEVLEKQVEEIVQMIYVSSRTGDRLLFDYFRDLYTTSLSFMLKHKLWVTEGQQNKVNEANVYFYQHYGNDK